MKLPKKTITKAFKSKKEMWNILRQASDRLISVNHFTGNGWGDVFALPSLTLEKVRFEVFKDGCKLRHKLDYSIESNATTTIQFKSTPPDGADLHVSTYTTIN